jgi:zinc/manganese transport system substrate-binding protein
MVFNLRHTLILSLLSAACCSAGYAEVNIVTSIPDLADIAKEIGQGAVSVFSLARGTEDYHMIQAKSSFFPKIHRANLVISLGLAAEARWLTPIVETSRNSYVQKGNPGWVEVAKGIEILEKPLDSSKVSGHKMGNPHFNTGPYCGKIMAKDIYEALVREDKKNEPSFTKNYQDYLKKLEAMEQDLVRKAGPLRNVHVVSYHADLAYFCKYYGMKLTGCLEPSPGIAPNPGHLAQLIADSRRDSVKLVLYHQAQSPQLPEKVAEKIGAQTICFANMVNSRKEIHNFIDLQEYNLNLMLEAIAKGKKL